MFLCLSDFRKCRNLLKEKVLEKVLDLRPKSVCAVEMTMYVHWTCIDINIKNMCE